MVVWNTNSCELRPSSQYVIEVLKHSIQVSVMWHYEQSITRSTKPVEPISVRSRDTYVFTILKEMADSDILERESSDGDAIICLNIYAFTMSLFMTQGCIRSSSTSRLVSPQRKFWNHTQTVHSNVAPYLYHMVSHGTTKFELMIRITHK